MPTEEAFSSTGGGGGGGSDGSGVGDDSLTGEREGRREQLRERFQEQFDRDPSAQPQTSGGAPAPDEPAPDTGSGPGTGGGGAGGGGGDAGTDTTATDSEQVARDAFEETFGRRPGGDTGGGGGAPSGGSQPQPDPDVSAEAQAREQAAREQFTESFGSAPGSKVGAEVQQTDISDQTPAESVSPDRQLGPRGQTLVETPENTAAAEQQVRRRRAFSRTAVKGERGGRELLLSPQRVSAVTLREQAEQRIEGRTDQDVELVKDEETGEFRVERQEQFGDVTVRIPEQVPGVGGDTVEGTLERASASYSSGARDVAVFVSGGRKQIQTDPQAAAKAGAVEGALQLANPGELGLIAKEGGEAGAFIASKAAKGDFGAIKEGAVGAGSAFVSKQARFARENPQRAIGSFTGSGAATIVGLAGAAKLSPRAGKAASLAVQPEDELILGPLATRAGTVGRRVAGGVRAKSPSLPDSGELGRFRADTRAKADLALKQARETRETIDEGETPSEPVGRRELLEGGPRDIARQELQESQLAQRRQLSQDVGDFGTGGLRRTTQRRQATFSEEEVGGPILDPEEDLGLRSRAEREAELRAQVRTAEADAGAMQRTRAMDTPTETAIRIESDLGDTDERDEAATRPAVDADVRTVERAIEDTSVRTDTAQDIRLDTDVFTTPGQRSRPRPDVDTGVDTDTDTKIDTDTRVDTRTDQRTDQRTETDTETQMEQEVESSLETRTEQRQEQRRERRTELRTESRRETIDENRLFPEEDDDGRDRERGKFFDVEWRNPVVKPGQLEESIDEALNVPDVDF